MKHSTSSHILKTNLLFLLLVITLTIISIFIGKYPLTISGVINNKGIQTQVFLNIRLPRVFMALIGGFGLSIAGFIYQIILKNNLAAPDIIGVGSGASAGAAFGIVFFSSNLAITSCSFAGALLAVILTITLSGLNKGKNNASIVLSGICIHALAQTVLMMLKIIADPEKQLSSIEYWIMGSLNGISARRLPFNIILCLLCVTILFMLHRHILILSNNDNEAMMLGEDVKKIRFFILVITTLMVSSIISLTGLISFIGLVGPHIARLIKKDNRINTMFLAGLIGSIILLSADIFARSIQTSELPVSIFTNLVGVPFLIVLLLRRKTNA